MTVDSATAASQNGICSRKPLFHQKIIIVQNMTKNINNIFSLLESFTIEQFLTKDH
jgi:hypothetical protein